MVPMIDRYLFIRKYFINARNQRDFHHATVHNSSFWVPRMEKLKKFADRNGKFSNLLAEIFSVGGDTSPHPAVGTVVLFFPYVSKLK